MRMPENTSQQTIQEGVAVLRNGALLVIPTETVYGLAADAGNDAAVQKIFRLKGRPADHPLIVHIADATKITDWAIDVPDIAYRLAEQFWPGPLTLILKKHPRVSTAVTGGQDTIGLRCPDNPLTLALLRAFGGGVAAPSANRFGRISPTSAEHVRAEFGQNTPPVLDGGPCTLGIESTIVDLSRMPPRVLRPGTIRLERLKALMPDLLATADATSPRVSGALEAHYAPVTPIQLCSRTQLQTAAPDNVVVLALETLPAGVRGIALPADADAYAHGLYAALRQLDDMNAQAIWLESLPVNEDWAGVADRIRRAVTGSNPEISSC